MKGQGGQTHFLWPAERGQTRPLCRGGQTHFLKQKVRQTPKKRQTPFDDFEFCLS